MEEQQMVDEQEVDKVDVTPFSVDKIVSNGIELTSSFSLSSQGISTSGSRSKCYQRLVNHMKALELQAAYMRQFRPSGMLSPEIHASKLLQRDPMSLKFKSIA